METSRNCKRSCEVILLSGNRELSQRKLCGLSLVSPFSNGEPDNVESDLEAKMASTTGRLSCWRCGLFFESVPDMRRHYQSKEHEAKLGASVGGEAPGGFRQISEEDYKDMGESCGSDSDKSDSEVSDGEDLAQVSLDSIDESNLAEASVVESDDEKGDCSASSDDVEAAVTPAPEESSDLGQHLLRHTQLFFRNADQEIVAINKSLLMTKKSRPSTLEELNRLAESLPDRTRWAFLILSGGYFAGAIFNAGAMMIHKTFRSYTTRQKQGGSQSSRDAQGGRIRSCGASLRRQNEANLQKKIQELLSSWRPELDRCSHIFLRAPSRKLGIFKISAAAAKRAGPHPPAVGPVFASEDPRVRNIPVTVRRPTLEELKKVQKKLDTIEIYDKDASLHIISMSEQRQIKLFAENATPPTDTARLDKGAPETSPKAAKEPKQRRKERRRQNEASRANRCSSTSSAADSGSELETSELEVATAAALSPCEVDFGRRAKAKPKAEPEPEMVVRTWLNRLFTAVLCSDIVSARERLVQGVEGPEETLALLNRLHGNPPRTLLHDAVGSEAEDIVWLLMEHGCRPDVPNARGHMPYEVATNKRMRDVFRRFMADFPDKFDYKSAKIPSPLSEKKAAEKRAREAERRKTQRQAKREREKEKKIQEREKAAAEEEAQQFLRLSDREKRLVTIERQIVKNAEASGQPAPVMVRCFQCAANVTAKNRFEYSNNVFCSSKCLQTHRKTVKSS